MAGLRREAIRWERGMYQVRRIAHLCGCPELPRAVMVGDGGARPPRFREAGPRGAPGQLVPMQCRGWCAPWVWGPECAAAVRTHELLGGALHSYGRAHAP